MVPIVVLLLCACLSVHGATYTSPNLLDNPNCFGSLPPWAKSQNNNWTCGGNILTGYYFYPGIESIQYTSVLQDVDVYQYNNFIAGGGATLTLTANYKSVAGSPANDYGLMNIQQYVDYPLGSSPTGVNAISSQLISIGAYSTASISADVPANSKKVRIFLQCVKRSSTATCDVQFTSVSLTLSYQSNQTQLLSTIYPRGNSWDATNGILYFVENYAGTLSTYRPIRSLASTPFTGSGTLNSGSGLNLLTGTTSGAFHIRLVNTATINPLHVTAGTSVSITALGTRGVNFDTLDAAGLQNIVYGAGNYISFNLLEVGYVIAVKRVKSATTGDFDYAKLKVTSLTATSVTFSIVSYNLVGLSSYEVIGTGYSAPWDVEVTANGQTAYITDNDSILRLDLTGVNKNRTGCFVLKSGLNDPRQLALDEPRHMIYVNEYLGGRLLRVDLSSPYTLTVIQTGISRTSGLVIDKQAQYAYYTEQTSTPGVWGITEYNLVSNVATKFAPTWTVPPLMLTWLSDSQSSIIICFPSTNLIAQINIAESPVTANTVTTSILYPYSSAVISPGNLIVFTSMGAVQYQIVDPNFSFLGPALLGIGFVPVSAITSGLATTDAGYFYQVKNSPFGGSLPLMINFERARAANADYYRILFAGVPQTDPFTDYKWDIAQDKFVLATTSATNSRFPVRQIGEIWYNSLLGYFLDTTKVTENSLQTIRVEFYSSATSTTVLYSSSVNIRVDNLWPHAEISQISYLFANGTSYTLSTCETVSGTNDEFQFVIDATDPVGTNLLSWSLDAYWGVNQHANVAARNYADSVYPIIPWAGESFSTVPTVAWHAFQNADPYSKKCAHTFILSCWDRSQNGWGYLHYSQYSLSVSFNLS